jgi:hypothetical protein
MRIVLTNAWNKVFRHANNIELDFEGFEPDDYMAPLKSAAEN